MTHSFPTRRSSDRPGEHREPALGQVDAHVLEVVLACALHADQVVTVRRVSRHGPKLAPRPDTEPQSQPTPCATSSRPKTRNAAAAPYLMTFSGSCRPSSTPAAMASASAATMPTVLPNQVPNQPSWVARVIVASIVLSPSSARKNAAPTARIARPLLFLAFCASSSVSSSPRRVHPAKTRKATPATIEIQS